MKLCIHRVEIINNICSLKEIANSDVNANIEKLKLVNGDADADARVKIYAEYPQLWILIQIFVTTLLWQGTIILPV